jgi:ABC-type multidrug transport system ATPase subunit
VIEATALSKWYGDKRAVDDLSFSVRSGQVTGFLGPNGAPPSVLAIVSDDRLTTSTRCGT